MLEQILYMKRWLVVWLGMMMGREHGIGWFGGGGGAVGFAGEKVFVTFLISF